MCLLPLGFVSLHADWPPLIWKHAHFAEADIGQTIIAYCCLFIVFGIAYFIFPKLFRRQMNERLGRLHFGANIIAVVLLLAVPIYFNLTLHGSLGEAKSNKFFRAFGASLASTVWEMGGIVVAQTFFLANLTWSLFKGQKIPARQSS